MCNQMTVTYENVNDYKGRYSLGCMLNNTYFVTFACFDVHNVFFAISSQGIFLCYSDAFDWFSCLNLQHLTSAINTAWFKHLKTVNS